MKCVAITLLLAASFQLNCMQDYSDMSSVVSATAPTLPSSPRHISPSGNPEEIRIQQEKLEFERLKYQDWVNGTLWAAEAFRKATTDYRAEVDSLNRRRRDVLDSFSHLSHPTPISKCTEAAPTHRLRKELPVAIERALQDPALSHAQKAYAIKSLLRLFANQRNDPKEKDRS